MTTAVWGTHPIYYAKKDGATTLNNAGDLTLTEADPGSGATVAAATVNLAKTPTLNVATAAAGAVGYKFTVVLEAQAAASGTAGDFYTKGGLLYSQALATFDQKTASAIIGISLRYDNAQTSIVRAASPTLAAGAAV